MVRVVRLAVGDIEMGAGQFRRASGEARRRQWWATLKFKLFLFISVIFFIVCALCTGCLGCSMS